MASKRHIYITLPGGEYDHLYGDYAWIGNNSIRVTSDYGEKYFASEVYQSILISKLTIEEYELNQYAEIIDDLESRGITQEEDT